jgi:hypothetical protein
LEKLDRGETLAKALAVVQVAYLIVQLVARKVADLPSAQLEIGALAFSASSIITYVLYWNRPQGVESLHIAKAKTVPPSNLIDLAEQGPSYLWFDHRPESKFDKELDLAPIPNDSSHKISHRSLIAWEIARVVSYKQEILILVVGTVFGGTFFGGLHCLAWNFHFPTPGEALGWRICSVLTSALPSLSIVPLVIWMRWNTWHKLSHAGSGLAIAPPFPPSTAMKFTTGLIIIVVFLVPYVLARLFLIVEMFRTLFFLPSEAFIDTWSGSFPHWG